MTLNLFDVNFCYEQNDSVGLFIHYVIQEVEKWFKILAKLFQGGGGSQERVKSKFYITISLIATALWTRISIHLICNAYAGDQ